MKKDSKSKVISYPKVVVKKSFHGRGIFAQEDIKKGIKIMQYIGKRLSTKEADEKPNRYIFEINENWSLDGSPMWNTARYFNHSCRGNAESTMEEGSDRIFISAKKNIKSGEEITFNYGREYFNMYFKKGGCKCSRCSLVS